jgi:glycosyltransferase involved in cell wall biosynthesis
MEIILVDDASTDESLQDVEQWGKEKWRDSEDSSICSDYLTVVSLPRNVGFAGALTTGLFLARGEYIAIQDADDWSHPERLERQVAFLQENSEIDLVGTNYAAFRDGSKRVYTPANWLKYGQDIRQVYWSGGHCVCHGTIMFRGSVFDRIGGLTRRIAGAEDYEFIVKFLEAKSRIENLPDILYYYRQHDDQRSTAYFGK